ncbi:MAG: zinc ribbon domain-containing protein [Pseudomonadota bacterium]
MPIYEYQCESCGHRQDALQRMSDDPLVDCAACGQPALKKLMSAPRFRLKGSGWYETDFKSENKRNLADGGDGKADNAPSADAPKGDDGAKSSESKPAASGSSGSGDASPKKSSSVKNDASPKKSSAAN